MTIERMPFACGRSLWIAVGAIACFGLSPSLWAQETTAGIQGVVKDPSGAVIGDATVEVSSPGLIGTRKAQTDAAGAYRLAALPSGQYTMTVTAPGFRTFRSSGIDLTVGSLPNID